MARKKRRRGTDSARTPLSDGELIRRVKEKAPEFLKMKVPQAAFNAVVDNLLKESPSTERPHFYCRRCGEYHLKTHPHYRPMKTRAVSKAKEAR